MLLLNLTSSFREYIQVNTYLFKVDNRTSRKRREVSSKLIIKIPERRQWRRFGVFIVNFEHISHLILAFLDFLFLIGCNQECLFLCEFAQNQKLKSTKISSEYKIKKSAFKSFMTEGRYHIETNFIKKETLAQVFYCKFW